MTASRRVYVVRHAKAGDRDRWEGDDRGRPLTGSGRRQAEGLIEQLDGARISRVLSSPYLRCTQTVEPLACHLGLEVEESPALAEGARLVSTHDLIREVGDSDAVLCSHGDVIANLVISLAETGTPGTEILRWKKGSTWALEVVDGVVASARYLPPPV